MTTRKEAEERGYIAERQRAQEEKILSSAYRKLGRITPLDPDSLPRRTDNEYDPRKR